MPSDKHNSITANAASLIFSLLDIASAQDVSFGILQFIDYNAFFMDLHSSLLTVKSVDFGGYR